MSRSEMDMLSLSLFLGRDVRACQYLGSASDWSIFLMLLVLIPRSEVG